MLTRIWRGTPVGLQALPADIRNHPKYDAPGWYLDEANVSLDGHFYRLTFDGYPNVDYFAASPDNDGFLYVGTNLPGGALLPTGPGLDNVTVTEDAPDLPAFFCEPGDPVA